MKLFMILIVLKSSLSFPQLSRSRLMSGQSGSFRQRLRGLSGGRTMVRLSPVLEHGDTERFLKQVETTVSRVLTRYEPDVEILSLPPPEREALGVARNLDDRLRAFRRNNDCPRCWLQRTHCICPECPSLETPAENVALAGRINRIFVLMHHKEICLAVDTAKLILAAFPQRSRLIVGGIGPEFQESMEEFLIAMKGDSLVLFPSDEAKTFDALKCEYDDNKTFDVCVIDGTWEQARKLYKRYIPDKAESGPTRVQLSQASLRLLESPGHNDTVSTWRQLRRHPLAWREISTLAATRLLLKDLDTDPLADWSRLASYQQKADGGAREQLGEPRAKGFICAASQ